MTYGLLPSGFRRKTAAVIRSEMLADFRSLEGFSNLREGAASVIENLVSPFVNQLDFAWQGQEAVWQSRSPDSATGASLDNVLALVGNARLLQERTRVTTRLITTSNAAVTVPADNQVAQIATGTLFETSEDVEIPANTLTLNALTITSIEWQTESRIRYQLGSVDLSSVATGDMVIVTGTAESVNSGVYRILAVNDGSNWVDIENLQRSDDVTDEIGAGQITITNGWVDVLCVALNPGPLDATVYSLNSINTPLSGWDFARNMANGIVGRDVESDTAARRRSADELITAAGGTLEAVINKLNDVEGVSYASGKENRTAVVDGDGQAPHSQTYTVVGGADQDIWDCIGRYKGAGIETNGTEVGSYSGNNLATITVRFNRVTPVQPYIIVNLTVNGDWPVSEGPALVVDALVAQGETLTNWQDILNFLYVAAVANAGVPGILTIEVLMGLSEPPTLPNNIAVDEDEIGQILAGRITVNVA